MTWLRNTKFDDEGLIEKKHAEEITKYKSGTDDLFVDHTDASTSEEHLKGVFEAKARKIKKQQEDEVRVANQSKNFYLSQMAFWGGSGEADGDDAPGDSEEDEGDDTPADTATASNA